MLKNFKNVLVGLFLAGTLLVAGCAKDPCATVTCKNGGSCANGSCNCPSGWTGSDCGTQKTPTKMSITNIQVTRFPSTDNGTGWDLTSGPDISPLVSYGGTTLWNSPTYRTDATSGTYSFIPSPYIDITSPTGRYSVNLYDYDSTDPDDFMGGVIFTPYSSVGGFPSEITLDAGGSVAFKLSVTYSY